MVEVDPDSDLEALCRKCGLFGEGCCLAELAHQGGGCWGRLVGLVGLDVVVDEDDLRRRLADAYPTEPDASRAQWFGQLRAFRFAIEVGDLVPLPSADGGPVHVGEVVGSVEVRPDPPDTMRFVRAFDGSATLTALLSRKISRIR